MAWVLRKFKENPYGAGSLIYLILPIINLFYFDIKTSKLIVIVVIVVFSVNYVWMLFSDVYKSRTKRLIAWFIYLAGVYFFSFVMGPMFIMYFFFGAFVLPFVFKVPIKSLESVTFFLSILIIGAVLIMMQTSSIPIILVLIAIVVIASVINFRSEESRKIKEEIEEKNKFINLLIAEQERNRIGQDLHDTLGHVFASLSLKSELAVKLIDQNPKLAKNEMIEVNQLSKEALQKVRSIVEQLKFQSFADEVDAVKDLFESSNLDFQFEGVEVSRTMNKGRQSILAMVLREAVNNIIKHANANEVYGKLYEDKNNVIFEIEDDGVGIETNQVLTSIEERVKLLDGSMKIVSEHGTKIIVLIPRGE